MPETGPIPVPGTPGNLPRADAIVLAAPLWDLSFPALLKVYIENVSVEGITFGCGAAGCYGICRAQRMAFLTTRGSVYEGSHLEMGSRYLQAMAEFFGIRPGTTAWQPMVWMPPDTTRRAILRTAASRQRSWPGSFNVI